MIRPPRSLRDLWGSGAPDLLVSSLAIDSRRVEPGALFVALRGEHTDGHAYVASARDRGAVAAVVEDERSVPDGMPRIVVEDSARVLSRIADRFFDRPSTQLDVFGITGTNGKTTTAHMVAAILNAGGVACATIGTIGAQLGNRQWALSNTTPLALELHELLAQMRDAGARAIAMEVSSHALALARVEDVRFRVGALTNVTRDHLDFHGTMDAYAAAKRRLFSLAERCVLNVDDPYGRAWAAEVPAARAVTYACESRAAVRASDVELRSDGVSFGLDGYAFRVPLPGAFNVLNALCAIAIAREAGVDDRTSAQALREVPAVPGRMERLSGGGVDVIVDYAHTPDALANVLRTVRSAACGRVRVVFGCGGDRDRGKRPEMGEVAATLADDVFVTSDNPRAEDPQTIVDEIVRGIRNAPHTVILDRAQAIATAVTAARAGDVVVIAGKGHEKYQIVGDRTLAFDDVAVAREALARREHACA